MAEREVPKSNIPDANEVMGQIREKKEPEKAVVTEVKTTQKPESPKKPESPAVRVLKTFIRGELEDVKRSFKDRVRDVVIPGIEKLIFDGIHEAVDSLIFGKNAVSSSRNTRDERRYTSYSKVTQPESPSRSSVRSNSSVTRVQDVELDTYEEAVFFRDTIQDIFTANDWLGLDEYCYQAKYRANYVDSKWGWDDLSDNIPIMQKGNGKYILRMPPMVAA